MPPRDPAQSAREPHSESCECSECLSEEALRWVEARDLEWRMYELDRNDPERRRLVARYNAVCDELGVPSGDKDDLP